MQAGVPKRAVTGAKGSARVELEAAGLEHVDARGQRGRPLLPEARLADAGLAGDQHNAHAALGHQPPLVAQERKLGLAADEGGAAGLAAIGRAARRARAGGRGGRRPEGARLNRRAQALRGGERLHAELTVEHGAQRVVLAQRLGALAQPGVGLDQGAMQGLLQVVVRQALAGGGEDGGPVARRAQPIDQGADLTQVDLLQPLALAGQPEIELRGIAEGQPVEEEAAVEAQRGALRVAAGVGRLGPGHAPLELPQIDPGGRREREAVVGRVEYVVAEGFADGPEDVAQVLARGVGQALGPEQRLEVFAGHRVAGDGEIGEEADGLGGREIGGMIVVLEARAPEQPQAR